MKCDETHPQCQQCLRAGRVCPGPLQGPVMVNMTGSIQTRARRPYAPSRRRAVSTASELAQVPPHHMMMQLFMARYLTYFCGSFGGRRRPWMRRRYEDIKTVDLSFQAAALAHYGTQAAQSNALVKSRDLYIKALEKQRGLVGQALNGRWTRESLAVEMVSSNLMLAFFEATQGTTPDAYLAHIHAAAAFLGGMGPEYCKDGILNQLFFAVRSQLVSIKSTVSAPILNN